MPFISNLFLIIILSLFVACRCDYFKEFEDQMMNEKSRQAVTQLNDDFLTSVDSPKEIEIICQGSPMVTIKDLITDHANAFEGSECMVLKLKGDNFSFRLSLNCEESQKSEFSFGEDN
jgi:hypothetical protein